MKKILTLILALALIVSLAACGKTPGTSSGKPENSSQSSSAQPSSSGNSGSSSSDSGNSSGNSGSSSSDSGNSSGSAPEGAVTDETKLGEAIAYRVDSEGHVVVSVKTSAYIKKGSGWLGICPLGIYLTEESADAADSYYEYFDSSYDKEWLDGVYTFVLNNENIVPDTYTMVLCDDDDSGNIIGEWIFNKTKSGSIEIGFDDSWLKGAGKGRHDKEFDSLEKEVASWFSFSEYDDEWAEFLFDGYYLEEVDPQGYDKYYLMVCPEGDYSTYDEAMEAHVGDYSGILEKCPYLFSIYHSSIEKGKYTLVLAKMGGDVEVQFGAEKVNATEWKMDFSNAKCPKLESKYAGNSSASQTD